MEVAVDLVAAARTGDQDAWALLYRGVHRRLRAYIARRVDASDVEDVLGQTMARAVAGLESSALEDGGFDAWIFGIARRSLIEYDRRMPPARRRRPQPAEGLEPAGDDEWLRGLFQRLLPADRELLELQVACGLTPAEVARVVGRRPGSARLAQERALNDLRGLMAAEDRRSKL
jgi:RNA polymerase sigma-70 factor (ECF subfamily)